MVKLGTNLPEHLIGKDPGALTEFLSGLEELGYDYVTVGDHVLGADLSVRPNWRPYHGKSPSYGHQVPWHEPMVLFGYLAALTRTLELSTGILISTQRQTALLAKQAAEVDVLTGGRQRLVISIGYNDVEFEALGVDFSKRGPIMDEQVELLRQFWTREVVNFEGEFHRVSAAGINPLPVQRPIPLWFGGQSKPALRRIGRVGDGWFPYYPYFSEQQLHDDLAVIQQSAREAGRDPAEIGIEGAVYFEHKLFEMPPDGRKPPRSFEDCLEYAHWWKSFGATHYWVTAPWADLGPEESGIRTPGVGRIGVEPRLRALADFKTALGSDF